MRLFYHRAHNAHFFSILHMGIFPCKILDGVGCNACRLFPVSIQRMTGQIQAADFLFLLEQFLMAVFRQLLYFIAILGSTALCSPLITENRSSCPSRLRRESVSMLFRMPSTASTWLWRLLPR